MRGRRVRVHDVTTRDANGAGGEALELRGRVLGVDADGALRLERDDGQVERVLAGDVTVAKGETP